MDRKKTILIAVLINAGLLAILFVASLVNEKEERDLASGLSKAPLSSRSEPLFFEATDLALQQSIASSKEVAAPPFIEVQNKPEVASSMIAPSSEETLIHKLPPLVSLAESAAKRSGSLPHVAEPSFLEVVVKQGDSLEKIARAHHMTAEEIIQMNHLSNSFLRVGQVLKLPVEKKALQAVPQKLVPDKTTPSGNSEYYIVKVGDNPWTIAMKHHLKVEELLKLNHLDEEKARKLKPGDRLRIN